MWLFIRHFHGSPSAKKNSNMKKPWINSIIILSVLLITGYARLSFEQKLNEEMLELKLIPKSYDMDTRIALKQKSFAAGIGSLRPTIAAFMNVSASNDHSKQDWQSLESKFNDIVLLDPHNPYYWETGSWHLVSNASASSRDDEELPEVTRRKLYRQYINKGTEFIDRGIQMNPDSWQIASLKAKRYANKYRLPDFDKAADEYLKLSKMPNVPSFRRDLFKRKALYCLAKVPDKHQEAYDLAYKLYQDPNNRVPSLLNALWIGQSHPLNKVKHRYSLLDIYKTQNRAYKWLRVKWIGSIRHKDEAMYGVEKTIRGLEQILLIPQPNRVFPTQALKPMFIPK